MLGFPQGRRDAPRSKTTWLDRCYALPRRGSVGIFVGPLVGALMGELLGGNGLLLAGRFSRGTLIGTTAGIMGMVY